MSDQVVLLHAAFNPITQERVCVCRWILDFDASLVDRARSKSARARE